MSYEANRKFIGRWATDEDRRGRGLQEASANGVVVDVTHRPHEIVCFASPVAMAQRIASSLNLASRFELDELNRLSEVIAPAPPH